MSLRQQAKILGVSHSLLSKCLNGKRRWNPELKERYDNLVTTMVTKSGTGDSLAFPTPSMNSADKTAYTGTKNLYNIPLSSCGAVAHLGERFNGIEEDYNQTAFGGKRSPHHPPISHEIAIDDYLLSLHNRRLSDKYIETSGNFLRHYI